MTGRLRRVAASAVAAATVLALLVPTVAGASSTHLLVDIRHGPRGSDPGPSRATRGHVLMTVRIGPRRELWTSDGTRAGTRYLKGDLEDLGPYLARQGDLILFDAERGDHVPGLWRTDLTPRGTRLLMADAADPVTVRGRTYFHGPDGIYRTDGSRAGTERVGPYVPLHGPHLGGSVVVCWAPFPSGDGEPGIVDLETFAFTQLKDVDPGPAPSCRWDGLAKVGDLVYYAADDGEHGEELWRTDGTPGGTVMVRDIDPGPDGSGPGAFRALGGRLYFAASDSAFGSGQGHGRELWRSDGTEGGTVMVSDIDPGADGSGIQRLARLGRSLLFGADDGMHGVELWRSDGTRRSTRLVKDIRRGTDRRHRPEGSFPTQLTTFGPALYFRARGAGDGPELWRTDGTTRGTVQVADIAPGTLGSSPHDFVALGRVLLFVASDGVHGDEPWVHAR